MPNKELGIADPVYDALRIRSGQSIAPDLGGGTTGGGGVENKIYVWHADGSTIDTFNPDSAGLTLALAAAAAGDVVWIPATTIAGNHTLTGTVRGLDRYESILSGTITIASGADVTDLTFSGQVSASNICSVQNCNFTSATAPALTLAGTLGDSPLIRYCVIACTDTTLGQYALVDTGYTYVQYCDIRSLCGAASIDNDFAWISFCRFHASVSADASLYLGNGIITNCDIWSNHGNGLVFTQAGKTATVTNSRFRADDVGKFGLYVTQTGLTLVDNSWNTIYGQALIIYGTGDRMPAVGAGGVGPSETTIAAASGNLSVIAGSVTVTDDANHNGFPGLCEAPDGTLLLVYRVAANHAPSKGVIVKKTSADGGATWSGASTIVSDAVTDVREPQLTRLANGNVALVYSKYSATLSFLSGDQVYITISADNGGTWSAAVNITTDFTDLSYTSAPVVELPNGDLLMTVYGKDTGDTYYSSRVVKSTDSGATWAALAGIGNGEGDGRDYVEPNIVLLANGDLLCLMHDLPVSETNTQFYAAWSGNSGANWTSPIAVMNAAGRPTVVRLSNGMLLCIYRNRTTKQTDYQISRTNGVSWEAAAVLWNTSVVRMAYAAACEYEDGLIGVAIGDEDANTDSNIIFVRMYTTLSAGQLKSTVPTGTAPLVVSSTTLVSNLNADFVDGLHAADFPQNLADLDDVDITGSGTGDVIYNNAGTWIDYPLGIGSRVTVSGTKIRFGNVSGGNYLEIDSVTGTLRLVGDATTYDDFRVEASVIKPGATAPNWKAFGPSGNLQALMFEASHHDEAYFEMQMPHNWLIGSNIYPHVHWTPVNATAGNVVWELEYAWSNVGSAFGAPSNMATDATAAGGVAWVHKLTDFKSGGNNYIDGTGKTLSSMLVCRVHRNSNAGSDTLNQDVALLEIDFHYQIDSLGSDEPMVKDASASLLLETGDILLLETGDRLLTE